MSRIHDEKKERFSRLCALIILGLTLIFMAFLLPMAFIRTTGMSTGAAGTLGEVVSFNRDNVFLNLIVLAITAAGAYLVFRLCELVPLRSVVLALVGYTLIFGMAFVLSAKLQPSEDSYIVSFFARQAARGDVSYYHEYFRFFPFQFGFVMYEEAFFRLFYLILPNAPEGYSSLALQGLNVIYICVCYVSLVAVAGYAFENEAAQRFTAILFFFFLPAVLMATYMYGNIPALACSCGALWCFFKFHAAGRPVWGLMCALLLALAVCLKLNSLIFVVAIVLVWLILLIKRPRLSSALCLALTLAAVVALRALPQQYYERRCGESFGGGIPQLSWMAMGMSEGKSCSGWYDTRYTADAYKAAGYDRAETERAARAAIDARLDYFASEPTEARRFFSRKLLSQWNEPTFQGLWNNQVRKKYSDPGVLYSLVCVRLARRLTQLMNYYQQLIYFMFTLGLMSLLRRRSIRSALLPLIILGGLLYHLLFEAKSQYALGYFMLMIPVAACGLARISERVGGAGKDNRNGNKKRYGA